MKILKNKKCLASIASILVALALIAGSTMAWFVLRGDLGVEVIEVGYLDVVIEGLFGDYIFDKNDDDYSPAEPGQILGPNWLIANDQDTGALFIRGLDDWDDYDDGFENGSEDSSGITVQWGKIENTGNLDIILKLVTGMEVTRYWEDPDDAFPSEAWLPYNVPVDSVTGDYIMEYRLGGVLDEVTAGYPGVDGAVIGQLIVPPTINNLDALGATGEAAFWRDDNDVYYLRLKPGVYIDCIIVVDLLTNAVYDVLNDQDPDVAAKYLDNTYMECDVQVGFSFVATQGNQFNAWADVFGETIADHGGTMALEDLVFEQTVIMVPPFSILTPCFGIIPLN
ncbi:MAG: hypothetical protein FWE59_01715 [Oscillospiraceae bacterium]|nr:hypothetical protein [Oscillospiraceae bacterium]